jgi:lipopolysaccharide export system protein LptA
MSGLLRFVSGLIALGLLAPVAAVAQGIDLSHGGPIAITARDGIDWLQQQHEVIANGDARAVRQNVTVTADRLIAFYRKKQPAGGQPQAPGGASAHPGSGGPAEVTGIDNGDNEIYRLEAIGNVVITTPTDRAQADRAVYDLDKAVLVLTGNNLRLTTPNDVLTARDDVEYWSAQHMAVARGDAVVVTKDNRRLSADVLVAYTVPQDANAPKPTPASARTQPPASSDPLEASGKLQKVEAFGHVVVATPTDVVTGDRGVYVPDTGIAILLDNVHITRGQNELAGSEAEVNVKTGISRLIAAPKGKVQGLLVPNEAQSAAPAPRPGAPRR